MNHVYKDLSVLVKYKNRKIYSPRERRYISSPEAYSCFLKGGVTKVVDHVTKRDITVGWLFSALAHVPETERQEALNFLNKVVNQ